MSTIARYTLSDTRYYHQTDGTIYTVHHRLYVATHASVATGRRRRECALCNATRRRVSVSIPYCTCDRD